MGTSAAASLARIKVAFPAWSIRKIDGDPGSDPTFIAERGTDGSRAKIIHASSLGDLESKLRAAAA